jgi:SulP family sulfate permease
MSGKYRFNRMEIAGSLGDLGTLLPISIGMILVNRLDPVGLFFSVGLFFVLSGIYFGVTVPVQPMKVVGAYSIAMALSPGQITASGLLLGILLLAIGLTGLITVIGRYIPKSVVRGVQLSTGVLLMSQGVRFMVGTSKFQALQEASEPLLRIQHLGPVPLGIVIGVAGGFVTLRLLDNRRFPAGLLVVLVGLAFGAVLGTHEGFGSLRFGIYFPSWLPFGVPTGADFSFALLALVLPQIPMTLGNAVVAYADLSRDYFGDDSARVTYRGATISMGLANLLTSAVGGMPLCHGAGGLAAHYRFGSKTAGSNLVIGGVFLALALFLGPHAVAVIHLLPMAVLGVLLLFAGGQLSLTIIDLEARKDLFIALLILGITLASNLAAGFIVGTVAAHLLASERFKV